MEKQVINGKVVKRWFKRGKANIPVFEDGSIGFSSRTERTENKHLMRMANREEKLLGKRKGKTEKEQKLDFQNKGQKYRAEWSKDYPSYNEPNRQAEKNRINENAEVNEIANKRTARNWLKYSEEMRREKRHENLQKKLADYKKLKEMQKNERERMQKGFDNKIGSVDYDKMSMEEIRIRNLSDEKFKKELKKNIAEYKAKTTPITALQLLNN